LEKNKALLSAPIDSKNAKSILDGLGTAASQYRKQIYEQSFTGTKKSISLKGLTDFVALAQKYLEHSIAANKRTDDLYHAYNLMTVTSPSEVSISHLSEMLEGQVAVLSSGYLSSAEALEVLDALKNSLLFRPDQYSYMLYPNKQLPGFLAKNTLPKAAVAKIPVLQALGAAGDKRIIEQDVNGAYHFNGNFKNANDLRAALKAYPQNKAITIREQDQQAILDVFEEVFNHKAFTGRSGTFFGYEGLGSIYWHMVSKLQLAAQECCIKAIGEQADEAIIGRLLEHYYEINAGVGVNKPPSLYGAFPTDPYSHTPAGKGAQQPGMTGQVKEDILSRFGELGVFVKSGKLNFNPVLLRKGEFLSGTKTFEFIDVKGQKQTLQLDENSLCFTYGQVPIVYKIGAENKIEVLGQDDTNRVLNSWTLDTTTSKKLFNRTGEIKRLLVHVEEKYLR
jgi:hypothetical protein